MLQLHNVTVKPSFCSGSETFTRKREDNGCCIHTVYRTSGHRQ